MLTTRHNQFLDSQGRQVLLHGINLVNKDPKSGYLGAENGESFAALRQWGFNCIRLGVIWDGLEPQPGIYNEEYLTGIDQRIAWARQNDLYVLLDMHQDLYSVLFSDGAPEWATLSDGHPHQTDGSVWDDAYYTSPALQAAFDHFWKNSPASDGAGLQDHYRALWERLAKRYCSEPGVIGYDLMNEPMPGAVSLEILLSLLSKGAELMAMLDGSDDISTVPSLTESFLHPEGRLELFERLKDANLFAQLLEAPFLLCRSFEKDCLMPMYRSVGQAIRAVDQMRILFLETSGFSNFGIYSSITPIKNQDGGDAPQQAYAPHCYDLVTDTEAVAYPSHERLELIYSRHAETAKKWGWPMFVGEWGAYGFMPDTLAAAQINVRQIEKWQCSETYWTYEPGIEQAACFPALWRPYPERIAGKLERYHHDPQTKSFECAWIEDPAVTASTVIYLPDWLRFTPKRLAISPAWDSPPEVIIQPAGTWLHIPPTGKSIQRMLTIQGCD